jgi:hypothetical protein
MVVFFDVRPKCFGAAADERLIPGKFRRWELVLETKASAYGWLTDS